MAHPGPCADVASAAPSVACSRDVARGSPPQLFGASGGRGFPDFTGRGGDGRGGRFAQRKAEREAAKARKKTKNTTCEGARGDLMSALCVTCCASFDPT